MKKEKKKYIINNKKESYDLIIDLGLNKFQEDLFYKGETDRVLDFINKYPAKYYAIRDKSMANGLFKLKVRNKDVIKEIFEYDIYTINVSSINYVDNQKLVGEIMIDNDEVYLTVSCNCSYSVRDAVSNPDFNIKCCIFDDILDEIPYFDLIYSYIIEHELKGLIVEFAVFDRSVGINDENIIIYELRTEY